ncbi:hypothetical protein JX266_000555 [Neoarthrinium moseri]|uniref:uncharacterized protein n=1 Tax=Neoarthrinium moseri TaxID=1658444 RepID=UPI001FDE8D46|nr:uncharacterized protein JN550_004309 [Neoarthrinium moseri]KAI1855690.1 hypothetical protein JX266_000555 [Neoarthrinium moseri]KAI1872106.1 hypothetical protein JN550_004309 [Neoarthrinium moseri]
MAAVGVQILTQLGVQYLPSTGACTVDIAVAISLGQCGFININIDEQHQVTVLPDQTFVTPTIHTPTPIETPRPIDPLRYSESNPAKETPVPVTVPVRLPPYCSSTTIDVDVREIPTIDPHNIELSLKLRGLLNVNLGLDVDLRGLLGGLFSGSSRNICRPLRNRHSSTITARSAV